MYNCWICFDPIRTTQKLCKCSNDYSHVHKKCIEKWVLYNGNMKCKFCNNNYKISNTIYCRYLMYKFINKIKYYYNIFDDFNEFILDNRLIY